MQTIIGTHIEAAAKLLQQGALVAIPTETVYGLAANALDTDAVLKIFEAKNRPQFNPLIVHIKHWNEAKVYAQNIPEEATRLAAHFCPGPLTFLLPKKNIIPDLVTAGSPLVALRVPNHPTALALLGALEFPLAAPSANEFGYISPTTAQHVYDSLAGKINYILDGGTTEVGVESTIIGFSPAGTVIIHRVGGIAIEEIEAVLGKPCIQALSNNAAQPQTSGQLKSHYAPHTELYIGTVPELAAQFEGKKIVSINFCQSYPAYADKVQQFVLSTSGDLKEAARQLFSTMRLIDQLGADIIIAERFPDEGLGKAINDRLQRAQASNK